MRIRQLALVAADLEPTVATLCDVLGLEVCYRDPGVGVFGLHNALMTVGDQFLEVVSPVEEGTTAGRLLEKRGGDGGYMVILQCGDALAERKRIEGLGIRSVWTHDADDCVATHFHPADVGGAILSIDHMDKGSAYREPMARWNWAGPDWQKHVKTDVTEAMVGAEIQAADPAAMAEKWSKVLDLPTTGENGTYRIRLDGADLRFVGDLDGRGPGLGGIDIRAADPARILKAAEDRGLKVADDQVTVCGVRVYLV